MKTRLPALAGVLEDVQISHSMLNDTSCAKFNGQMRNDVKGVFLPARCAAEYRGLTAFKMTDMWTGALRFYMGFYRARSGGAPGGKDGL